MKPIYVIPNCVNFEDINIDDEFLANKEKKIVYVGRIVESHKHVSHSMKIRLTMKMGPRLQKHSTGLLTQVSISRMITYLKVKNSM